MPDVEIAPLSQNKDAISASLRAHSPDSETPTVPALQGAVDHASAWASAHPDHAVIVVLATDGLPFGCGATGVAGDIDKVSAIAATALAAKPSIKTFVIGVTSTDGSLSNLTQVAQAGGTTAFIVNSGDVEQQFLDALNQIRGSVQLACEYTVPQPTGGGKANLNEVNLAFTPGSGPSANIHRVIYPVADATQCAVGVGGWYYDKTKDPVMVKLCDSTCSDVSMDRFGELDIVVGCQTIPPLH
jgi:hypothetical protein